MWLIVKGKNIQGENVTISSVVEALLTAPAFAEKTPPPNMQEIVANSLVCHEKQEVFLRKQDIKRLTPRTLPHYRSTYRYISTLDQVECIGVYIHSAGNDNASRHNASEHYFTHLNKQTARNFPWNHVLKRFHASSLHIVLIGGDGLKGDTESIVHDLLEAFVTACHKGEGEDKKVTFSHHLCFERAISKEAGRNHPVVMDMLNHELWRRFKFLSEEIKLPPSYTPYAFFHEGRWQEVVTLKQRYFASTELDEIDHIIPYMGAMPVEAMTQLWSQFNTRYPSLDPSLLIAHLQDVIRTKKGFAALEAYFQKEMETGVEEGETYNVKYMDYLIDTEKGCCIPFNKFAYTLPQGLSWVVMGQQIVEGQQKGDGPVAIYDTELGGKVPLTYKEEGFEKISYIYKDMYEQELAQFSPMLRALAAGNDARRFTHSSPSNVVKAHEMQKTLYALTGELFSCYFPKNLGMQREVPVAVLDREVILPKVQKALEQRHIYYELYTLKDGKQRLLIPEVEQFINHHLAFSDHVIQPSDNASVGRT